MGTLSPRRVVVTGMGAVTSLGTEVPDIWNAVLEGRSGIGPISQFDSSAFPVRIGSEIDLAALPVPGDDGIGPYLSRSARFGIWAMDRAWRSAGLDDAPIDPVRAGVCVGASTFPLVEGALPDPRRLLDGNRYNAEAYLALCTARPDLLAQRNIPVISSLLSLRRGLRGPSVTVQSACTSATQAIGESFWAIRDGVADVIVTGGTDSMMSVVCVTGFTLLGALSTRCDEPHKASRPFDLTRDGFVIGEGAGLVILEDLDHARRRGAPILAELIGYGSSSDGYRFTDIRPDGSGAASSMCAALNAAGIRPRDVDYINAHGTSTPQNDRVETLAIKRVFGDDAYRVAVSSTKSQLGHLVCAAGGIEFIFTVAAALTDTLPPTMNLEHPDPECDLDYVPNEARRTTVRTALSNSFGFGGQNGTLVVRKWEAAQSSPAVLR